MRREGVFTFLSLKINEKKSGKVQAFLSLPYIYGRCVEHNAEEREYSPYLIIYFLATIFAFSSPDEFAGETRIYPCIS